jgi:spore germination protein
LSPQKKITWLLIFTLLALAIIPMNNGYAASYGSRVLKLGSRGDDVKLLQTKLNNLNFSAGTPDGIFGPKTKTAVMAFQKASGITVDGIVGQNTYAKLNKSENKELYRVTVNGSVVNLRNGPGTNHAVIGQVTRGKSLSVIGQSGDWLHIAVNNSTKAWIAGWLTTGVPSRGESRPDPVPQGKVVLGYYPEDYLGDKLALTSLKNHYQSITDVAAFAYTIAGNGQISGRHFKEGMTFAKEKGIRTYALVHNYSNGGFDQEAARQLLNSPANRQKAVNNLLTILKNNGYTGVHLDLENIAPTDRALLTQFVKEVKEKLTPAGYKISMAVPAKVSDSPNVAWVGAFDYKALGELVDEMAIMTYDEHYLNGRPGPVASYPWVEKVIKYATSQVPSNKILLGIATYGYEWGPNGGTRALTHSQVSSLLSNNKLQATWNPQLQVPHFTYKKNGQTYQVWFENSHSARIKLHLINQYNLKGIAIWRLGFEDPELWQRINEHNKLN